MITIINISISDKILNNVSEYIYDQFYDYINYFNSKMYTLTKYFTFLAYFISISIR